MSRSTPTLSMNRLNALLVTACRSPKLDDIQSIIQTHHTAIDMSQLLGAYRADNKKREQETLDSHEGLIEESVLEFALREYRPFTDATKTSDMFMHLCMFHIPIRLFKIFIELYACELTTDALDEGLLIDDASYPKDKTQAICIVTACADRLGSKSFWAVFTAGCYDQNPVLLENMINRCHCPIPELMECDVSLMDSLRLCCENNYTKIISLMLDEYGSRLCVLLPKMCSKVTGLAVLQMVFDKYIQLLTPDSLLFGLAAACQLRDTVMIGEYADNTNKFDQIKYFNARSLRLYCEQILDRAIQFNHPDVVDVMLARFQHLLMFEKGHAFESPETGSPDEIAKFLGAAYGSRFAMDATYWRVIMEGEHAQ